MTRDRSVFAVLALALIVAQGCKKSENAAMAPESTGPTQSEGPSSTLTPGSAAPETGSSATAQDQPQNPSDLALVQAVRQELVGDKALSMSAQNVKIVAVDGQVTLRGQVQSPREKDEIATKV